jgi:hypothetical protein
MYPTLCNTINHFHILTWYQNVSPSYSDDHGLSDGLLSRYAHLVLRCLSGYGGLHPLGRSRPCTPSSPVLATSFLAWIPCAPLPCVGIFARAAPCHRASHLLIAHTDALSSANLSSFFRRWRRHHPLPAPAQALPGWTHPAAHPLHHLRWIHQCRGLPDRIPVATTFPA